MTARPSPSTSNPVLSEYGRALASCSTDDSWMRYGRSNTPLATNRWRSSRRVGPHSPSRNWFSGVMLMPLPLYDATGWPPQARELAST
jgi:hypothetical protein